MRILRIALLLGLWATVAQSQIVEHPPDVLATNLPTCNAIEEGRLLSVTDGSTAADCDGVGGGDITALCQCQETSTATFSWQPVHTGPTGSGTTMVTQASHGFSSGQWLQFDSVADAWELLDSDVADDSYIVSYILVVVNSNSFLAVTEGSVTSTAHGLTLGPLYAGSTAGVVSSTFTAGLIEWVVGVAIDANTIIVQQKEWFR